MPVRYVVLLIMPAEVMWGFRMLGGALLGSFCKGILLFGDYIRGPLCWKKTIRSLTSQECWDTAQSSDESRVTSRHRSSFLSSIVSG